jgi:hypothetical protein
MTPSDYVRSSCSRSPVVINDYQLTCKSIRVRPGKQTAIVNGCFIAIKVPQYSLEHYMHGL